MATAALHPHAPVQFENNPVFVNKQLDLDHQINHHGAIFAKQLIGDALRQRVESIDHETCEPGDEDTFFWAISARSTASTCAGRRTSLA